ncbi:hypothetical protein Q0Y04_09975 [Clostridioides difficile]|nr:hypothetical protein Q0Y04_09975 [Clostridioides difficile]
MLTNTLDEKENKYKKIEILDIEKADRYVKSKKSLEELFGKYKNIYYYAVVNKGLFRGKEVYAINIYNEKIYAISENGLNEY